MQKGEEIDPFLLRLQGIHDQLNFVGSTPNLKFMVRTALNVVTEDWETFVQSILGRATLPSWEEMWVALQQEELKREKYMATIPLYLEIGIQKTYPMKPSPAQLKLSAGPFGLYVGPKTLCISPLRHCTASRTLYVTPSALYVDDTVSLGSALPLLGSA
ncbi:Hypothetical predicted protein [Olea europaea subsp. europaea]|uniref:Uncharacterized protein n=1 Tax=Olea europaea subsp. europaea TaxID=158383 RepID=A0A8S0UGB7_OLEEU|nr:Hypothetical predicted protein [Olea europaea subsp. europaea]